PVCPQAFYSASSEVYIPKDFFLHAASLDQAFAHCPKSPTAASRRSRARLSVPLWPAILSDRLPVVGLVVLYTTNYLMGRRPLPWRLSAFTLSSLCRFTHSFPWLSNSKGHVPTFSSPVRRYAAFHRSFKLHRSTCMC